MPPRTLLRSPITRSSSVRLNTARYSLRERPTPTVTAPPIMANVATAKRDASHLTSPDDAKKPKINKSITSFFGAPKPVQPVAAQANKAAPKTSFKKDQWVAKLTPEQRELLDLEINTLGEDWMGALKEELISKEFLALKRFIKQENDSKVKIFPPPEDIYSWSRYTPLHNVKVLIVGQDPYHNVNQAHGLCFSVRPPTPAPPSLKNIFTAIQNDYADFQRPPNNGGLLTPWAERGVLLLNTCLTVRAHQPNSHAKRGWERFTQKVIDTVAASRTNGIVFMAWGTPAGQRVAKVDRKRHLVLQAVHPSPLSAHRGFMKCGHFKKANEWLHERYGEDGPINWSLVPPKAAAGKTIPQAASASTTTTTTTQVHEKITVTQKTAEKKDEYDDDEIEALLVSETNVS